MIRTLNDAWIDILTGHGSAQAAESLLRELGFEDVLSFEYGFDAFERARLV